MDNNKIAIYPGTFDPVTLGHLDIIARSAKVFEGVIVAVAQDSKKITHFSFEERVDMLNYELKRLKLENVKAKAFKGLLVDFIKAEGARIIVRGLRALADFEYEFQMSYINHKLSPDIETVFLPATENGHFISSSFVNEIARLGGNLKGFVSEEIAAKIKERYSKK
ncbi:phosphopantetheine adenylyltransferase [endosymbiont of Acanthamoeba sp. UWC8]|uniref:pantetheine-phosphate adenylyltransferase n=1 Tax=endosymbiont of Acanthamoeba sp. UWC8 TaxID=86106 RepID=UPI0004D18BF4|nr:pantetheine-phosphate adenylyltransferase [endosymbiont of Acanthamoeba sp. UWC8]AIF81746.1 phosphopantetheine adenylyltransferase [endosymbiont of Acanthamoeba sp. UWC8]